LKDQKDFLKKLKQTVSKERFEEIKNLLEVWEVMGS
jgi:hypothetical protein